jgi:hypothetical protein
MMLELFTLVQKTLHVNFELDLLAIFSFWDGRQTFKVVTDQMSVCSVSTSQIGSRKQPLNQMGQGKFQLPTRQTNE